MRISMSAFFNLRAFLSRMNQNIWPASCEKEPPKELQDHASDKGNCPRFHSSGARASHRDGEARQRENNRGHTATVPHPLDDAESDGKPGYDSKQAAEAKLKMRAIHFSGNRR
jgi:hypothetical protein